MGGPSILLLGGYFPSRNGLLKTLDHDPFVSREALFDHLQVVDSRTCPDTGSLHYILFVHDQHIGTALVISDCLLRDELSRALLDMDAHTGIESRHDLPVGIWENPSHQ